AFILQFEESAGSPDHDPLELLRSALANGHEVDDDVDALDGPAQAGRIGHVTLGELAAERREPPGPAPVADEAAHRLPRLAQRVHDVPTDEARSAGDEDHFAVSRSKFCQYRLGVGPCWPWYFEPSPPEP